MRRAGRSLVSLSLMILVALLTLGWAPTALAQATPVTSAAEAATPMEAAPCVAVASSELEEEWPAGLVREMLFVTEVDSSGFESPGPPIVPALVGVASQICIEPNTTIVVGVDLGPPTENVSQFYTTSILALSGELEIKLVEQCANPSATGTPPCTVQNGSATFRTGGDRHTVHELAIGEWTPIPPGSIVTLTDVTVSYRTGDSVSRILTSGVWEQIPPGGTCPGSCRRWKSP